MVWNERCTVPAMQQMVHPQRRIKCRPVYTELQQDAGSTFSLLHRCFFESNARLDQIPLELFGHNSIPKLKNMVPVVSWMGIPIRQPHATRFSIA